MILFLCEKPSQAADIARVLECTRNKGSYWEGDCLRVTWCLGHLLEVAPPEYYHSRYAQWCMDDLPIIPSDWAALPKADTLHQLNTIGSLLGSANSVVIATDADREGELIAREVLAYCNYQGDIQRLWLHALDEVSIRQALTQLQPGNSTWPLYQSALARQRADWLIGVNLSRAMTLLFAPQQQYVFSVGRVQTPTLALVHQQDQKIASFKPQLSFETVCDFQSSDGVRIHAARVRTSISASLESRAEVTRVQILSHSTQAPFPFTLSDLQQSASLLWGYSAHKTLDIAQSLYEHHKAISYPRTACPYLPQEQFSTASHILKQISFTGLPSAKLVTYADVLQKHSAWDTSQVESHHGILPLYNKNLDIHKLSQEEARLYDLICESFVRLFLPAYQARTLSLRIMLNGSEVEYREEEPLVLGWKIGHIKPRLEFEFGQRTVWDLKVGENLHITKLEVKEKTTAPPRLLSEGQLIEAMKSLKPGLGTESTRAHIIEKLLSRKYLKRSNHGLSVTAKGRLLLHFSPSALYAPQLTLEWEKQFQRIVENKLSLEEFLSELEEEITHLLYSLQKDPDLDPAFPVDWCM